MKELSVSMFSSGRWRKHIQLSETADEHCSQTYPTRKKHAHTFIVSWRHSYMLALFRVKLKDNVTPLIFQRDLDFFLDEWTNQFLFNKEVI